MIMRLDIMNVILKLRYMLLLKNFRIINDNGTINYKGLNTIRSVVKYTKNYLNVIKKI